MKKKNTGIVLVYIFAIVVALIAIAASKIKNDTFSIIAGSILMLFIIILSLVLPSINKDKVKEIISNS
jgi:hypothetical protein